MNKRIVFGSFFSVFILVSIILVSSVQGQGVLSSIEDQKNNIYFTTFNVTDIDWNNVSAFLLSIAMFSLKCSNVCISLVSIGRFLQKNGFEMIGYRLFTLGLRSGVFCIFVSTISLVLNMLIDHYFLPDRLEKSSVYCQTDFLKTMVLEYHGGSVS
jgi:hypothetical protein